jgi:hypothetical protein
MSLGQSCENRRSLQYIDVIVGSRHPKEGMPNLVVVIGDSFKDHTAFPIAAFVQPLPRKRARKSSCCILCKDLGRVFFSWLSQISWTKHYHNCPTKLEDTIFICRFGHA